MTIDQLLAELEILLAARKERKMSDYKLVPVEKVRELIKEAHYEGQASATGREPSHFRWVNSQVCRYADTMLAAAPDVHGEPVGVADALRQIATWMDDGGPTYHEAELIGMAISGPVECSSAKRCTQAAKKAFLEAARIWELMHPSQPAAQQPAPDVAQLVEALEAALGSFDDWCEGQDPSDIADAIDTFPWVIQARTALAANRKGGDV